MSKRQIINLAEDMWENVVINPDQENYILLKTTPLLTCYAYTIIYDNPQTHKKNALLCHAMGGDPEVLKNALEQITSGMREEQKIKMLNNAEVFIALNRTSDQDKKTLDNTQVELKKLGLCRLQPAAIVPSSHHYCIDTNGDHGKIDPEPRVDFAHFKSAYLQKCKDTFFKNPKMKNKLLKNEITTIKEVELFAKENKKSRTEEVLKELKDEIKKNSITTDVDSRKFNR